MRKIKIVMYCLMCIFIFTPFLSVNAITECARDVEITTQLENFQCVGVEGDIKISYKNKDYTEYFTKVEEKEIENSTAKIVTLKLNKEIPFEDITTKDIMMDVSDSKYSSYRIKVLNTMYKESSETTTTTTTTVQNTTIYTATLDPNNGENVSTDTCTLTANNTSCTVKLPVLKNEGFSGWGTAKTCKDGKTGTMSISSDTTFYACYDNTNTTTTSSTVSKLFLNSLEINDKKTQESVKYGTFSKRNFNYSFKVLNEVESININAKADEGIDVEIVGNEELKEGENEVLINLSNESGESGTYTLKVTRLKEGETISTTHLLKSLVIGSYNIDFNKTTLIYDLKIGSDVDKLDINAIAEEEEIEPVVENNINLVNGSVVTINLTGEDENTTVYTINITKEAKTNILLICAIGVIVLLIIVLVALIIVKSNKKKKKNNNTQMSPNNIKKSQGSPQNGIEVFKI